MGWDAIIGLIITEGLPVAEAIFTKWQSGQAPTLADFAELRALASQRASDRTKLALANAGIALDSDKAKEILALVG